MPEISYTTTMDVPRADVWEFVRDMNNWAPFTKGYQAHEITNERESIWTVKGELGPITRTTKFHVVITEWIDGERVGFTVTGLNEPISGAGAIELKDTPDNAGTEIIGHVTLTFGGSLGPIVNQFLGPFIKIGADELVTKIALALQPDYQKTSRPLFLVGWLQGLADLLMRPLRRGDTDA